MKIFGTTGKTYLFLNGLKIHRPLQLGNSVELLPARCTPSPEEIMEVAENEVALGLMAIFLRQVESQLLIVESDPKKHAALAWNSLWDAVLLSAFFDCEVVCNFQSNSPAEEFNKACKLEITNYHLRGLTNSVYEISEKEAVWLEENFSKFRNLIDRLEFQNAIHCMSTYRWHSHPRAQLTLLWSGIEGLFKVESEITFRLSLYVANFLEPDSSEDKKELFESVKKLYKSRSKAVHGSKIDDTVKEDVRKSAKLLNRLILECVKRNSVPCIKGLAP